MQDMTRSLRYLFLLLFVGVTGVAMAQVGGITGKVLDNTKEPIIGAFVEVSQAGVVKVGTVTDEEGNYMAKPLNPGRYDVTVKYTGFNTSKITGVIVSPDKNTTQNVNMQLNQKELDEVVVVQYKVPLIGDDERKTFTSEDIEKMPTRSTQTVVAQSAGVYQSREGAGLNIGGSRSDGAVYIIDGIRVYGSRGTNLSQGAIDQVEVLQSGVSAKYGDAIGGIINITTKGVSKQTAGGILLEKSVEGYGHNLVNFNLSGPLFSKKIDSVNKKPVVGFRLDGDFYYDKDRSPSWTRHYQPNDGVTERVTDKPLVATANPNGNKVFNYATEYLRASDFHTVKARPNAATTEGRLNGRLDFQLDDNLNLQIGGTFNYSRSNNYSRGLSLFALDAIPVLENYTGRAYVRLTQRFTSAQTAPGEKKPVISNAYYSVQADYQKEYQTQKHPQYGTDLFKYYYVGKFTTNYSPIYSPGVDDTTGLSGIRLVLDRVPNGVKYERSEMNPELANYTTQFYNEYGSTPTSLTSILAQNYLINGYGPNSVYGLYNNVGTSIGSYSKASVDQFAVGVDASFDFQPGKIRHQIEFGLYYQQQVDRGYAAGNFAGSTNIWQYARQLSNSHISLDYSNPIFVVGGQQYTRDQVMAGVVSPSPYDTIIYNRRSSDTVSTFATNLRNKLGLKKTDYVDVDNYDPSMFSLDMFSADELQNNGNPFVSYRGYDYTGKRLTGQVNFNDFFTKKDANGNYTREIGAYRPSYIAGYLLDRFAFKDINFNLGVRIDRFDANTKVLKDPYTLYETYSALDVQNGTYKINDPKKVITNTLNNNVRPSNIGDDYVVYVNNNQSTSANIIGYRNGDDWYDYAGKLIEDPNVLKNYSGGRDPQPLLKNANDNIKSTSFDPDKSFTDYKPQVNVAPRISFNFPISEQALFYAHYDVLVQRPTEAVFTPASSYYYLTNNTQDIIGNPNLKSQKLFDYEVGFKQALTKQSAITITAFYKERKDMIQVRPYLFAWPVTYYTYGNRDFSTAKGFTLTYDMRRVGPLKMNIAYTLQFAEGTGSNSSSTARGGIGSGILQNFISAGLPNMRMTNVLDYDSRHNIVANLDYRYDDRNNAGPVIGGQHIFKNTGINIIARARSGEPYTKYRQPVATTNEIDGGVNGSRLGWHFGLDARLDKDFELNKLFSGKNSETSGKRPLMLNAYVYVTNLFNIKDILSVDGYTGRPDDDGYLTSPQGQLATQTTVNPASYVDYYNMTLWNNGRINLPRRINVGLQLNF